MAIEVLSSLQSPPLIKVEWRADSGGSTPQELWRPGWFLGLFRAQYSSGLLVADSRTGALQNLTMDRVRLVPEMPPTFPVAAMGAETALDAGIEQERSDRLEVEQFQAHGVFCRRMERHLQDAKELAKDLATAASSTSQIDMRDRLVNMLDSAIIACQTNNWQTAVTPLTQGFLNSMAAAYLKLPEETRHLSTVMCRFRLGPLDVAPLMEVLFYDGPHDKIPNDCQLWQVPWDNGTNQAVLVREASASTTAMFDKFMSEASLGGTELT